MPVAVATLLSARSAMLDITSPSPEVSRAASEALENISNHEATALRVTVREDSKLADVELPSEVVPLLVEILGQIANGNGVRVVPVHAELTTQQAADILNVSRPYLIKLLEGGTVPFHLVGTHRRVKLGDLLDYKRRRDAERSQILDELTAEAQELGLGY
jgi:excisionase family DNA binding protein